VNEKWVVWNLREAVEEIQRTIADLETEPASRTRGDLGSIADQPPDGYLLPRPADAPARGRESDGRGAGDGEAGGVRRLDALRTAA
jgi:hypothetical protein